MGHLVSRFPALSETFVASEIQALGRNWPEGHVFAFFKQEGSIPDCVRKIHYLSPLALYLRSQFYFLLKSPVSYLSLLGTIIKGHLSDRNELAKVLVTWPKMVHAAYLTKKLRLDAVHAHWASIPGTCAFVVTSLLDKPLTFTAHAFDIYKRTAFLGEKLDKAQLCITCTEYNRDYLLERYPFIPPQRIKVVYHGVDIDRFTPPSSVKSAPPLVILSIGRMTWQKGFPTLIKSVHILVQQGLKVKLLLLGLPGPVEPEVNSLIQDFELNGVVSRVPPMPADDMPGLYHRSHVMALPCEIGRQGQRDGIPNVFLESMACGLPVVSTPISGIPELVVHEKTGLLVPPSDAKELAQALSRLYRDEKLRASLGANARHHVVEHFDRNLCHQKLVRVMEDVYGPH